jgi:hypothetical protein
VTEPTTDVRSKERYRNRYSTAAHIPPSLVCFTATKVPYDAIDASNIGFISGGRRPWLLGLSIDTAIAGTSQVGASRAIGSPVSLVGVNVENGRSVRAKCQRVLVNRAVYRVKLEACLLCKEFTWRARRCALENAYVPLPGSGSVEKVVTRLVGAPAKRHQS